MLNGNILDEIHELPKDNDYRIVLQLIDKQLSDGKITVEHALDMCCKLQTDYLKDKPKIINEIIQNEKIIIIDGIMGSGKSTYVIDEIINKNPDKRFLIVVPTVNDKINEKTGEIIYQSEVTRYKEAINGWIFEPYVSLNKLDPDAKPTKQYSLQNAIAKGDNIITSHSLIRLIDETTIDLLSKSNYTLIIDESLSVVCDYNKFCERNKVTKDDIKSLINDNWITINKNGFLKWNDQKEINEYQGKYKGHWSNIKTLCNLNSLMYLPKIDGSFSDHILMWNMPSQFFKLFEQTFICTYLWNGSFQKAYFDMNNIKHVHLLLLNHQLNPYNFTKELMLREDVFKLINLYNKEDLNKIGIPDKNNRYPLTHSWYKTKQKKDKDALTMIKRNTENYFKHKVNTPSKDNMFTTFKSYQNIIKGDSYSKGFVSCNAKATNEFRNKKSLAYLINCYPDTNVVRFFERYGVDFNQDLYAVSELLQWVWRSAIRDGETINLYLPSQRMRELLGKWALGKI